MGRSANVNNVCYEQCATNVTRLLLAIALRWEFLLCLADEETGSDSVDPNSKALLF